MIKKPTQKWDQYRYKQDNSVVKRGRYNGLGYTQAFVNANPDLNNITWDNNGVESHGFNNALEFQRWYNNMYGNEVGYIKEDGLWGNETANALNMAKTFRYGDKTTPQQFENHSFNTTPNIYTSTPEVDKDVQPGLNKVNRAIVRQGLSNQSGSLMNRGYNGISNIDQLRNALMNPGKDLFINDLAIKLKNRGLDISKDEDWEKYLAATGIKGNIGARDRRRIRLDYNKNTMKYQDGGQIDQKEEIKKAFAEFCKANKLEPNEESWKQFQQYLQQEAHKQTQMAKLGAKLNYIKQIKGECPEGTYKYYFKAGGRICSACRGMRTAEEGMEMPVDKTKKKAISSTVSNMRTNNTSVKVVPTYTKQDNARQYQLTSKRAKGKLTPEEEKELQSLVKKFNSQPSKVKAQYEVQEDKKGGKMKKCLNGGNIDLVKLRSILHLN